MDTGLDSLEEYLTLGIHMSGGICRRTEAMVGHERYTVLRCDYVHDGDRSSRHRSSRRWKRSRCDRSQSRHCRIQFWSKANSRQGYDMF